ncbi:MAG: amidohydrolase family protein [Acidimicrobiia bacterium]
MSKTLIRGGTVLTMGRANYSEADVLIDGDTIAEVGVGIRSRGADVVDATDTIVMPGFVDAHRHSWESLFRNVADEADASADDCGPHYQPDDVYAATLIGLLGAVEAGITSVVDWCGVAVGPDHVAAALQAHADSGIRSVFAHGAPTWGDVDWQQGLRATARAGADPLLTLAAGPREPRRQDLDSVGADWALARELGMRIHAHVGAKSSDSGAVSAMAERNLLDSDVTLVHCSHLDDGDLDALAASGASVALTPSSEMVAGLGAPPMQALIDRKIRPGLGVGDERGAPGDIFAQMRAVISLQHATLFDRKLAGQAGVPKPLTTREVIRYATSDGANAAGLGGVTGSLEQGKQADIVLLRTDRPNIAPVNDPIGAVVWGMDTSNVDWVFVGGRAVMRAGALDADVQRARDLATAAQQRVAAAAGLVAGAVPGGRK